MIDDRPPLPQLEHRPFLTDSGLETTLIFIDGIDLPEFAAFPLLETSDGRRRLRALLRTPREHRARGGLRLHRRGADLAGESPTGPSSLGYDRDELDALNKHAITLLADLRDRDGRGAEDYVISGCIGPRGDGYDPSSQLCAKDAERYHAQQIESFADTQADLVSAMTLTHVDEAIGVTWAAQAIGIPAVISFTLETDGRLPVGHGARRRDRRGRRGDRRGPGLLHDQLRPPDALRPRARARAGRGSRGCAGSAPTHRASSHAELDDATELDDGDPVELGGAVRVAGREVSRS